MAALTEGEFFDYVVVGAGIEGSWSAYQLLRAVQSQGQGKGRVLLLEQFLLPHSRGSSHGQTRIIRYGYSEKCHAQLMPQSYQDWLLLQEEAGETLFVPKDLIYVANESGYSDLDATLDTLRTVFPGEEGSKFRELTPEQLAELYPAARFSSKHRACVESSAGVLLADRCLAAVQRAFCRAGGILRDGVPVTALQPPSTPGHPALLECMVNKVKITLNAGHLVVCAGPWTGKFLDPLLDKKLPLDSRRMPVFYWKIKEDGPGAIKTSFIDLGDGGEYWGIPELEYPDLFKLCFHAKFAADPDARDAAKKFDDLSVISNYIQQHFPGLESSGPTILETCMYTMTPDHVSIIDYLPGHKNIVFASGFSGSGFKKAPAVGRLVTQLLHPPSTFDTKPFALNRFTGGKN